MNFKNIFFGIILIAILSLFTFLLFIGIEYFLKFKAEEAGIFYKPNNERAIILKEQNPGSVIFTRSKDENGKLTRSGVDERGFLLPISNHIQWNEPEP